MTKENKKQRLAIPSMWPGGLESARSGHFGQCDCFTLVDLDDEGVIAVHIVPNPPHQRGSCLSPVQLLQSHDAQALIVHGIGMRPLVGFQQAGIEVYQSEGMGVNETVKAFLAKEVIAMDSSRACGGGA